MTEEVWKDIPGYEGRYQASTEGRIRSLDRKVRVVAHGTEATRTAKGKILRPGQYCKSGHVSVVLGHGANGSPVHKLVALTFLGPCPEGKEVLHNDGDPKNNRLDNLRYGTRTENILDVFKLGRAWRKLTTQDVYEIRKQRKLGIHVKEIAQNFNVAEGTIYGILSGKKAFKWLS